MVRVGAVADVQQAAAAADPPGQRVMDAGRQRLLEFVAQDEYVDIVQRIGRVDHVLQLDRADPLPVVQRRQRQTVEVGEVQLLATLERQRVLQTVVVVRSPPPGDQRWNMAVSESAIPIRGPS